MAETSQPSAPNQTLPLKSAGLQVVVDDCWSRIGVAGDGSCPELEKHYHCRNCPAYAAAGAQLLERSLSNDYRREWALHFARPKSALAPGAISVVLFRVGTEWLALPTSAFLEVTELRKVHSIPHRRKGTLLGLVNVRGELVVCLSLAKVLGLKHAAKADGERTVYERLLVASWQSHRVVFPVDEVHGVHRFDPDQLREPPATLSKSGTSYTKGVLPWQGRLTICLDAELLFPALSESIA
jgi:chemotaxis-related protein WspD